MNLNNHPVAADRQEVEDEFQSSVRARAGAEQRSVHMPPVSDAVDRVVITDHSTPSGPLFSILVEYVHKSNHDPEMVRFLSKGDLQKIRETIDIKLMQYPD